MKFRLHRNNTLMLNLTGFSLICVLMLLGIFAYGGGLFPGTEGAGPREIATIWVAWSIIVALPVTTAGLWLLRLLG